MRAEDMRVNQLMFYIRDILALMLAKYLGMN